MPATRRCSQEFLWWIGDIYAASYGSKRGLHLEPLKTLQSRGILWSGGSEDFVTTVAARYGVWASAARQTAKGTSRVRSLISDESF